MNEADMAALKWNDIVEAWKAVAKVLSNRSTHSKESIISAMTYTTDVRVLVKSLRNAEENGITLEADLSRARKQQEAQQPAPLDEGREMEEYREWFSALGCYIGQATPMKEALAEAWLASARRRESVCDQKKLQDIIDALDEVLGDTDPDFPVDMTDEELRDEDPLFWVFTRLVEIVHGGGRVEEAEG